MDFTMLAQQCAADVQVGTMRRIVQVESSFNPNAIGVVGGRLERQPRNRDEAIATAQWLERNDYNYSVGLAQVNKKNLAKYGLTLESGFDACLNLKVGAQILKECFVRARQARSGEQVALRDAFSCYYSGNFVAGYTDGYVLKVLGAASAEPAGTTHASRHSTAESEPRPVQQAPQTASALMF
jgi:type IV secretion system protein VirB1